jgi:hypothetical protein
MSFVLPLRVSAVFSKAAYFLYQKECLSQKIVFSAIDGTDDEVMLSVWDVSYPILDDDAVSDAISKADAEYQKLRRKAAYQSESDALVIRAVRLQLAGDPGADAAKDEALAKVAEIKARIPDLETK